MYLLTACVCKPNRTAGFTRALVHRSPPRACDPSPPATQRRWALGATAARGTSATIMGTRTRPAGGTSACTSVATRATCCCMMRLGPTWQAGRFSELRASPCPCRIPPRLYSTTAALVATAPQTRSCAPGRRRGHAVFYSCETKRKREIRRVSRYHHLVAVSRLSARVLGTLSGGESLGGERTEGYIYIYYMYTCIMHHTMHAIFVSVSEAQKQRNINIILCLSLRLHIAQLSIINYVTMNVTT